MRNFNGLGAVKQPENNTNGNYNGFQTGLRIQGRWGLSGEVDYTYSHEIDMTSQDDLRASTTHSTSSTTRAPESSTGATSSTSITSTSFPSSNSRV